MPNLPTVFPFWKRTAKAAKPAAVASAICSGQDEAIFALQVIEAASYAIDDIRSILEDAADVVVAARDAERTQDRAALAERYNALRNAIDPIAEEAEFEGARLVGPNARAMEIHLDGGATFNVGAFRLDLTERGLDLPPAADGFASEEDVEAVAARLDGALSRLDRAGDALCRDARFLSARLALTRNMAHHRPNAETAHAKQ